jgi:peptide/nickel transport system permease protein
MRRSWMLMRRAPLSAKVGLAIVALNLLAALLAPLIAPHGETVVVGAVWAGGFWASDFAGRKDLLLLGTDQLGRDLLSRMLYGARNTIAIAIATTTLSFAVGVTGGFLAATLRGWTDQLLSRAVDILMAFPTLIFALLVLSVMGTDVPVLILVIALLDATRVFRISRAVAMDVAVLDFVEAARLRGEGLWWVMRREILPNAAAPLVAEFGLRFCFVFLFIAALSFLGLGLQPPAADWGSMVRENAAAISWGIVTPLIPAAAIALLTVGVNLVADWFLRRTSGIRDVPSR